VLKPGDDLDLAKESLGTERICQPGMKNLDRYPVAVLEVLGRIDHGRPLDRRHSGLQALR
jgi:hypothetical protein